MMWVNEERKINKTIMDTVKKYKKHLEMSKNWRLFSSPFTNDLQNKTRWWWSNNWNLEWSFLRFDSSVSSFRHLHSLCEKRLNFSSLHTNENLYQFCSSWLTKFNHKMLCVRQGLEEKKFCNWRLSTRVRVWTPTYSTLTPRNGCWLLWKQSVKLNFFSLSCSGKMIPFFLQNMKIKLLTSLPSETSNFSASLAFFCYMFTFHIFLISI